VLVQSFGVKSGAFGRSACWSLITCGFTTNPANAKAVGRNLGEDDFHHVRGDDYYDAFPTMLGNEDENPDDFSDGYQDARILAAIVQEALDELYHCDVVDGYRNKIEGAFRIKPNARPPMPDSPQAGPLYVNMHGHAIANGGETNLQFIADTLAQLMEAGLQKFKEELLGDYHPDVLVLGIPSAEALVACTVYAEKVVAVEAIVKDAMLKPGATLESGQPNPQYVKALDESRNQLLDGHIPNLFGQFSLDDETRWLRRRKTVGNMQFRDGYTFIGREPNWHKEMRHKKAKALKDKRAKAKTRRSGKAAQKASPGTLEFLPTSNKSRNRFKSKNRSGIKARSHGMASRTCSRSGSGRFVCERRKESRVRPQMDHARRHGPVRLGDNPGQRQKSLPGVHRPNRPRV
jgi:hypothetical protein